MKKRIILLIVCVFSFCFFIEDVYADFDIYERTAEKPLVPDNVVIDDTNRDIILKTPAVDASKKIYDFADILIDKEEYKKCRILKGDKLSELENYLKNLDCK